MARRSRCRTRPPISKSIHNRAAQPAGVGFPIARLVALFSLASGAVMDMAVGPYRGKGTGEPSLFRQLLGRLQPESVVLGDRYFCSYWNMALLINRNVQSVFRLHQLRKADRRCGFRLGADDRLVTWQRPACPAWMTPQEYAEMPQELFVRLVWVRVRQRGFRVTELCLATTLLDPHEASAQELANLFRARWQAELHLRSLKSVLQMDVLRCKTPEMVRKELWMHLLVYNLIREVMAQAAGEVRSRTRYHQLQRGLADDSTFSIVAGSRPAGIRHALRCIADSRPQSPRGRSPRPI